MDWSSYLESNWETLKSAPFVYLGLGITAFLAGFACSQWLGKERLATLSQQLKSCEQAKQNAESSSEKTIQGYKERLGIVARDFTAFSKYTNDELRAEAQKVCADIHYLARIKSNESSYDWKAMTGKLQSLDDEFSDLIKAFEEAESDSDQELVDELRLSSDAKKYRARQREINREYDEVSTNSRNKLDEQYMNDLSGVVVALRDEILRRLPRDFRESNIPNREDRENYLAELNHHYTGFHKLWSGEQVAVDLLHLANSLP